MQIIPASVQSATPTTIKVINSSAKAAKVQRAPRISGEDRSSPGNRTGIFALSNGIFKICQINVYFISLYENVNMLFPWQYLNSICKQMYF